MDTILFPARQSTAKESLAAYRGRGGYEALSAIVDAQAPARVIEEVQAAGLRGRGGAAFPTGTKLELTAKAQAEQKFVVANGGEDEPGSFKDRILMEHHPHLILEGVTLCALAVGATKGYLYVNRTYAAAQASLAAAMQEAAGKAYLGRGILGSAFSFELELFRAPTPYVAGEDTAALEVLEGKDPVPREKPPYPVQAGLFGKPTLVSNIETMANIPRIVLRGAAWFRGFGTAQSPGTMIFCLGEEVRRPGAYELPLGTPLRQLIDGCGGGLRDGKAIKAILPGGPSTAFLPATCLDTPLDHQAMRDAGSILGCGVMELIPVGRCMLEEALKHAGFFAAESCGACPACRMETSTFQTLLRQIKEGKGTPMLLDQFDKVAAFNRGKGRCSLIAMAAAPVLSAVRHFRGDFEHHLAHGTCPPG
ncbi:MAG: SLBB domain-containing protein [Candidatus Tectomicrobia bacterium]|nr:SLBB domain-containing protein [Candidatus Tectomicrobia bacterium]